MAATMLEAVSRPGSFIDKSTRRLPRSGRDSIVVFLFAWLATLLPVLPYGEPVVWLWGALGGVCIAAASWMLACMRARPRAIWSLLGCTVLISVATYCDFSRTPPAYLLSRCRTAVDAGFALQIWNHMAMHWLWFPITNTAMCAWICLGFDAAAGLESSPTMRRRLRTQLLPRLGYCALMMLAMGMAASAIDAIGANLQTMPTADAFVSAMLCGMAFYHLLLSSRFAFTSLILRKARSWNKRIRMPHPKTR
jgi:hypothetical protein